MNVLFIVISAPVESSECDIDAEIIFSSSELGLEKMSRLYGSHVYGNNKLESDEVDYREMEKYQGDMILTDEQNNGFKMLRIGLKDESYRWPKNEKGKVIVPYLISEEYCE